MIKAMDGGCESLIPHGESPIYGFGAFIIVSLPCTLVDGVARASRQKKNKNKFLSHFIALMTSLVG